MAIPLKPLTPMASWSIVVRISVPFIARGIELILPIDLAGCRSSIRGFSRRMPTNVLGTELKCCCRDPLTGFYRDGYCRTGPEDTGLHTVCVEVTREFL